MKIKEIATQDVVTVSRQTSLLDAIGLLRDKKVGCLVVVDDPDLMPMPVGIVTDRDILIRAVSERLDLDNATIAEVMTEKPLTVPEEDNIYQVLGLMRLKGVRRAPLLDSQGRLSGIVTLDDLLNYLADEFNELANMIRSGRRRR